MWNFLKSLCGWFDVTRAKVGPSMNAFVSKCSKTVTLVTIVLKEFISDSMALFKK